MSIGFPFFAPLNKLHGKTASFNMCENIPHFVNWIMATHTILIEDWPDSLAVCNATGIAGS